MHIIFAMYRGRPRLTLLIERWLEEHESLALIGFWMLPLMVYVTIGLILGHQLGWLKWPLIAAATLFGLRWLIKRDRDERARKLMDRVCLHCGYDLRASPDRCPECGLPVSPGSGAMSVGGPTFLSAVDLEDAHAENAQIEHTGMSAAQ